MSETPASCKSDEIFAGKQDAEPETDATPARLKHLYSEPTDFSAKKMPDREGNSMTAKKI